MSYSYVQGHRSMAFDNVRNLAYQKAIASRISDGAVVMDLGAGVGIHGFMAAQLGAQRVYLVETKDVVWAADAIARSNEWGSRVHCYQGAIEEVALPEPVDIILSVFTGNFLLEEDLLPSLFYARDRYLKPDGFLIPSRGRMVAAPVCAPDLHDREIGVWSEYLSMDFSRARRYAANTLIYDSEALSKAAFLADPRTLLELDFYTCQDPSCHVEITYTITESGLCHGWAGWFDMELGDEWLSTNPRQEKMHWSAVMLPLDPPIQLDAGYEVTFRLSHPVQGEWSWWVRAESVSQQHSSAFSTPLGRETIVKRATQYQPALSPRGLAWRDLLARFDGTTTLEEMAEFLLVRHPSLFRTREQALQTINNLVHRCA